MNFFTVRLGTQGPMGFSSLLSSSRLSMRAHFPIPMFPYIPLNIEIISNTREGIVIFFTEKKGNAFFGGQIQVPDAGPGADWLS